MTGSSKADLEDLGLRLGIPEREGGAGSESARSLHGIVTIAAAPEPPPIFERMTKHLADATVELFAAYELPVHRHEFASSTTTTPALEPSAIATIGYVGQGIRGTLIAIALESAILSWVSRIAELERVEPADALGEFSNMLLGRLKTHLLGEGVCIQLATPTTTLGAGMRISMMPANSSWSAFDVGGLELKLRLDAHFDATFAIDLTLAQEAPAEAGEALLF